MANTMPMANVGKRYNIDVDDAVDDVDNCFPPQHITHQTACCTFEPSSVATQYVERQW
jgi:hypothetical protein